MPKEFKILSIDGGGVKGLYSASLLASLEEKFGHITDYFDLICGTSTGGIIALGLASGLKSEKIAKCIKTYSPRIFSDINRTEKMIFDFKQLFLSSRYNNKNLKEFIEYVLGKDRMLSSANSYLCIPATNIKNNTPRIYKTKHSENHSWPDLALSDIALATSAAPTYFPVSEFPEHQDGGIISDGGLFANNPALIGLTEALRVFVGSKSEYGRNFSEEEYNEVMVLSIGNFDNNIGADYKLRSAFDWINPFKKVPLVSCIMETQSNYIHLMMEILNESHPYFKTYIRATANDLPKEPTATPANEICKFTISDANPNKLNKLENYGKADGRTLASHPPLSNFFKTKKLNPKLKYN